MKDTSTLLGLRKVLLLQEFGTVLGKDDMFVRPFFRCGPGSPLAPPGVCSWPLDVP